MTSLAEHLHASTIPERIVAAWNAATTRWNPIATIVVAWAVLTGPLVFFRGYNSDEGLAVSIARTALEDGEWLVPYMFNLRWVERPTLLSWIIAAISAPFGGVNQLTARLPIVLFLLAGCLLIYALLRKLNASIAASLLGVALFLACPLVIRSNVMITADLPLAVLLFLAFFLWWTGYRQARSALAAGSRSASCWRLPDCCEAAAARRFRARDQLLRAFVALVAADSRTGDGRADLRPAARVLVRRNLHARR